MFFPYLTYGLLNGLYRNNRRSADPTGLADPYKGLKDRVARHFGYQPIPAQEPDTNTAPAPSAPVAAPAPVTAPLVNPVSTPATVPAPVPVPSPVTTSTPATAPSAAPASPSLPAGPLTLEGGKDVDFQAPSVDIPEFNTTPKPAPAPAPVVAPQAAQNPFYTTAPAPVTTPAPSQAPAAAPSTPTSQFTQKYIEFIKNKYRSHNPHIITINNPGTDRWKPYQSMNDNINASNANYYKAKSTSMPGKVANPVTAKSK